VNATAAAAAATKKMMRCEAIDDEEVTPREVDVRCHATDHPQNNNEERATLEEESA